jgi:uncharacterized membrane protein
VLVGSALTASCGGGGQKAAWQLAQDSAAAAAWNVAESGDLVHGIMTFRRDGWYFRPCTQEPYVQSRLLDSTGGTSFGELSQSFQAKPGDTLFAELRVRKGASGPIVPVTLVRRLTRAMFGGSCIEPAPAFVWRARGKAPPWNVDVNPERIILTTPENPGGTAFAEVPPRWAGTTRVYQGFNRGQGERLIEVRITRTACRDSTNGAYVAYTAELRRKSSTVLGCATAGVSEPASMQALTR